MTELDPPNPAATLQRLRDLFAVAKERGMNIEDRASELAKLCGVNQATIFRWRSGATSLAPVACMQVDAAISEVKKKYDID